MFHPVTVRVLLPSVDGRAIALAPRSMPTASAGTPYTTACSPNRITFPQARPIRSLISILSHTQRVHRADQKTTPWIHERSSREGRPRLAQERREPALHALFRTRLHHGGEGSLDRLVGGFGLPEHRLDAGERGRILRDLQEQCVAL